jgi:hypothetical protein
MKKINLKITKANIKNGERANPGNCPIANSIRGKIKNVIYVSVMPGEATIKVKQGKTIAAYKGILPKKGYNFIKNFDVGSKVSPFTLSLKFDRIGKELLHLV